MMIGGLSFSTIDSHIKFVSDPSSNVMVLKQIGIQLTMKYL